MAQSPAKTGRIIGFRKDGLGARILLLLNCIRIAEMFNVPYKLYWPTDDGLAPNLHHPEQLFSKQYMQTVFLSSAEYAEVKSNAMPMWKLTSETSPDAIKKLLARGIDILVEEGFEVIEFNWEDPGKIRHEYRSYIKQVDFVPAVQCSCEQIDAVFASSVKSSVAYHLRRGDILNVSPWKHTTWPSKIELDELYEIHLEKTPDSVALIFSDTGKAIEKFQKKYPRLKTLRDLVELEKHNALQCDFLELYAMSRADQIIAPAISAFSMAAARISGQQRVRFSEIFKIEDFDKANERTVARLKSGADTYLSPSDAAHALFRVSTYLSKQKHRENAVQIVKTLKRQQADNAFLDILQAANHTYLENWSFAAKRAQNAVKQPDIWPDDFAAAKAIEAMAYGHRNQRYRAGGTFREAYLFKPRNNSVLICGTNMSLNFKINERNFLPFDPDMLRNAKLAKNVDRGNSYIQNWIVNNNVPRRDFRFVTIDWHELVIDGKASRLTQSKSELQDMEQRLNDSKQKNLPRSEAIYLSMFGLIQAMLGRHQQAISALESVLNHTSDRALYYKRFAVVHELAGNQNDAKMHYKQMLALEPESPFFLHAWAMFQLRNNNKGAAFKALKQAAGLEQNIASISADYAMAAFRKKEYAAAEKAMQNAIRIIPVYGRFQNQLKRIQSKMN